MSMERRIAERYPVAVPAVFKIDVEGDVPKEIKKISEIKGRAETANISSKGACIRFSSNGTGIEFLKNLSAKKLSGQSIVTSLTEQNVTIIGTIAWVSPDSNLLGIKIDWNSNETEWLDLCSITAASML